MKLYAIRFFDDVTQKQYTQYVGTQADITKTSKELKANGFRNVHHEDADVPVDKAGLIAYLNSLTALS